MVARGEVWWYAGPGASARPHLILTRDEAIPVLRDVLAVPATSRVRGIPTEVALDQSDGMPRSCVLNLDSTALVPGVFFTDYITRLGPDRMQEVCEALRRSIAC